MSARRCACGNPKLVSMDCCFVCDRWNRKQNAGSAPEFGRGSQGKSAAKTKEATHGHAASDIASADSALSRSMFRHPSGRPRKYLYQEGPCELHNTPEIMECEICIAWGEREWERFHGVVDL